MLEEAGEFSTALLRLGVSDGYAKLRGSEATPEALASVADSELRLMLHHGSKFFTNNVFLEKIRARRTRVRFLLHEDLREVDREVLAGLVGDASRVEARTYSSVPDFRLVFVDQSYLVLSHYTSEEEERKAGTEASWEAPQLRIDARLKVSTAGVNYSLYAAFAKLWYDRWQTATPVTAKVAELAAPLKTKNYDR